MIDIRIQKVLDAADGKMHLDMQLQIEKGQFVTLYGESGAGKTSTLRMLAGLMNPDSGAISVHGSSWYDSKTKTNLLPQKRKIGYVFQDYALFPNMTVRENLEYASGGKNQKLISEIIEIIELGNLQNRKPETLSGGQKQRVALARAIAQQPDIILLDEPLSALDYQIRSKLQEYILKVHKQYNLTTILISHDIGEIMKLSDVVYMMESGKVVNRGNPSDVFVNDEISGKFKFTGEVLGIELQEVVSIVTVLIHTNVVKVIAQHEEVAELKIGDKVIVASKAFNPIIYKVG